MKKLIGFGLLAVAVFIGYRIMSRPKLDHFTASEFGVWYPLMNADLLTKLDLFRKLWGAPVVISSAEGGIGRHDGEDGTSQHNVDRLGEVRAIDVFPKVQTASGYRYIETGEELKRAYQIALEVGFEGIGVYTDTQPGHMLHVDTRIDEDEKINKWSRINKTYLPVESAWA